MTITAQQHKRKYGVKKAEKSGNCSSRSKYGRCSRQPGHPPGHAIYIGDGLWFVYGRPDKLVGYGHLDGEAFTPLPRHVQPHHF